MADGAERVGSQFGQYRIDALLGSGGMGAVYRAYDTVREREVALKVLHSQFAKDPTYQERFRRECRTLAKLGEPHIIPIHDFGEIDGVLYLDMRLVEGRDLRAVLRERGTLAPGEAVALIEQIAAALDSAHAAGLVHRDVKPENILVTDADFAYLVDFGIAHQASDSHLTQTGTAIGSIAYMAPEVFDDQQPGPPADVYALAAVLFECLTGLQPYKGDSVSAVLRQVVLQDVPAVSLVNPTVPEAFNPVLARGLAKDPAQRYGAAAELAAAARDALSGRIPDDGTMVIGPAAMPGAPPAMYGQTLYGASGPQQPGTSPYASGPPGYGSQPYAAPLPPAYQASQPVPVPPQGNGSNTAVIVLTTLIVVLVLALGGFLIYKFAFDGGDDDDRTAETRTSTTTVSGDGTDSGTSDTETTRSTASPPPGAESCTSEGYPPEFGTRGGRTSCPFANAVYLEYHDVSGGDGSSRNLYVRSPTTGDWYDMECRPRGDVISCTGGDRAEVLIYDAVS